MKSKKAGKSPGKKSAEKKHNNTSLASILLNQHLKQAEEYDTTNQTALLLETILSGSDENLQKILEEWVSPS